MMVNMKRTRIRSGKPVKRGDVLRVMTGNLFPSDTSSSNVAFSLSSLSNERRADTNIYYEEMKPLFVLLRMLGLLPYRVTSEGKCRHVGVKACREAYSTRDSSLGALTACGGFSRVH
jgi:hypothetical protein